MRRKPRKYKYKSFKRTTGRKGVPVIGSGHIIHNLRLLNCQNPTQAFDWALELNKRVKLLVQKNNHQPFINYTSFGKAAALAIPTPGHYLPLLYKLGLQVEQDTRQLLNHQLQLASASMTSLSIG